MEENTVDCEDKICVENIVFKDECYEFTGKSCNFPCSTFSCTIHIIEYQVRLKNYISFPEPL